jgi:hypothetical protein
VLEGEYIIIQNSESNGASNTNGAFRSESEQALHKEEVWT